MTNPFALQGKRTLKNKPCEPLQPNSPSCGNQPANIRIDTASNASTRSPPPTTRFGQPKRAPRDDGHQAPASPCPLDKTPYISVLNIPGRRVRGREGFGGLMGERDRVTGGLG